MRAFASLLALILAPVLALLPAGAAADPWSIRLGAEKIVLDVPPGFADTTNLGSPRLQDLAAGFNSPSNRVLLFGLTDADMRRFTLGDQLEVRRFVMVSTPHVFEQRRVTPEQFAAHVAEAFGGLGKPAPQADLAKYLQAQPIGKSTLLAELRKEPAVASVLQATRLPPLPGYRFYDPDKPQYLVHTTTLLLARGKALQLAVFSLTETAADVDWLREATQRWTDELQRLNPR